MDSAYISALSVLAGSAVGALTSVVTTWLNFRAQAKSDQLLHDKSRREDLYREFIMEASAMYGDALVSSDPQIPKLVILYAMISKMRVLSLPRTVASAEDVMHTTVAAYFRPNMTAGELHELAKNGAPIDPLRKFSEAARDELQELR